MGETAKKSPYGVGSNATNIVRSLGIRTSPKLAVKAGLDGATVLEMLGLGGTTIAGRLQLLDECRLALLTAREQGPAATAALKAAKLWSPEYRKALEAVEYLENTVCQWENKAVKLLLVAALENAKLLQ